MDCHKCKHSGSIPGDAHICCMCDGVAVKCNPHGVRNGWCNFPFNFDPLWIDECSGYEEEII